MHIISLPALTLCAFPTFAGAADQIGEFIPDDAASYDRFGGSVDLVGSLAVGGAGGDDDNGASSGSAYIFNALTGEQLQKLLPEDGSTNDRFGIAVGIGGAPGEEVAIVGSWLDNTPDQNSGSAYLFEAATGRQLAKLVPSDAEFEERFGNAVAINLVSAIVAAHWDNENGLESGAAFLFYVAIAEQYAKLMPDDGAAGDAFGTAVAISRDPLINIAVIGAPGDDVAGDDSGSTYLFSATTNQQLFKLVPNDGVAGDAFGASVAISGHTVIVGAPSHGESGAAYVFDAATGLQIDKLLPNDDSVGAGFGGAVATNGLIALVGAAGADDLGEDSGAVYSFDLTTGRQLCKTVPDDGVQGAMFGTSVSVSGDTAVIGAIDDINDDMNSGSAYIYNVELCSADLNCNGAVGPDDLAVILGNWGPTPPNDPVADLDGDGLIDPTDLAIVLNKWGPCS